MLIALGVLFVLSLVVLEPLFLLLGAKLCRIREATFRKALVANLLLAAATLFLLAFGLGSRTFGASSLALSLLLALAMLGAAVVIVRLVFRTTVWRAAGSLAVRIALGVALALALRATVVEAFRLPTGGMSPTLEPGDRVIVNKAAYWSNAPRRGDVVAFRPPHAPSMPYLKRVVAIAGDVVWIRDGKAYVNESPPGEARPTSAPLSPSPVEQFLAGKHPPESAVMNQGPITVPANGLYMLGDNTEGSLDSRYWGCASAAGVIGRAELIYWSEEPAPAPWTERTGRSATDERRPSDQNAPGRIRWRRLGPIR